MSLYSGLISSNAFLTIGTYFSIICTEVLLILVELSDGLSKHSVSTLIASDSVKCNFPVIIMLCGGSPKSTLSRLLNFPEIIFCVSNPILEAIIANVSLFRTFLFVPFQHPVGLKLHPLGQENSFHHDCILIIL